MQDLIKFGETNYAPVETTNARSGAQTVRLMRAKEFKEVYKAEHKDASNKDVKKAFEAYYKTGAKASMGPLLQMITEGKLGCESIAVSKDGSKLRPVLVDLTGKNDRAEIEEKLSGMSPEDLKSIMEYVSSKLPASV